MAEELLAERAWRFQLRFPLLWVKDCTLASLEPGVLSRILRWRQQTVPIAGVQLASQWLCTTWRGWSICLNGNRGSVRRKLLLSLHRGSHEGMRCCPMFPAGKHSSWAWSLSCLFADLACPDLVMLGLIADPQLPTHRANPCSELTRSLSCFPSQTTSIQPKSVILHLSGDPVQDWLFLIFLSQWLPLC